METDVDKLVAKIGSELKTLLANKNIKNPGVVGIHTGGAWVAKRIHKMLEANLPLGSLNISFYRDDFTRIGLHPQVTPSSLPFAVENEHIVLVDDVIMSGRTIRAALNELFDYGRPASVTLVALISIDARELPIQADIVGQSLVLHNGERIKLHGPDPLVLRRVSTG